jgi:hypothetical protein
LHNAHTNQYRTSSNLGSGVLTLGFLYMFLLLDARISMWIMSIGTVFIGLGLGQLMQTLMIAGLNAVGAKERGVATSSARFSRQIGETLGVAVFMTVLFARVDDEIQKALSRLSLIDGLKSALVDPQVLDNPANATRLTQIRVGGGELSITSDSSFLIGADGRLTAAFRIGFVESPLEIFAIAAVRVAVGCIISWFI